MEFPRRYDNKVSKLTKVDVFMPAELMDDDLASSESSPGPSEFDELSRPGSPAADAVLKSPTTEP